MSPNALAGKIGRFENEYPSAGQAIETEFSRIKGECVFVRTLTGEPVTRSQARFASDHDSRQVTMIRELDGAKDHTTTIVSISPTQTFRLEKDSKDAPYQVRGLGSNEDDSDSYVLLFGRFLTSPFAINGKTIRELTKSPNFRVISEEEHFQFKSHDCVKIECEMGVSSPRDRATLILDANQGWIARRTEFRPSGLPGAVVSFDIEYRSEGLYPTFPSVVKMGNVDLSTTTCTFDAVSKEASPKELFTTQYYGVAAPALRKEPSQSRSVVYWACLAIVGLFAAGALKRASDRYR